MQDDVVAARRAYDDAKAAIIDAERNLADAKAAVPQARDKLHAAIVAAAKAGVRQVDIAELSGYRRERIRQILRAWGVEPDSS
jgi:hypothetical protein